MRRSLVGGVVMTLGLVLAGVAEAQETGTPIFRAPYRAFERSEVGASVSDPGEGVDVAIEGFYSYGSRQNDFGVRAGFLDVAGDNGTIVAIGGNFRTRVLSYSEAFPLDGALTVGAGGLFGEGDDRFLIPIGVSLGRRILLEGSNTSFVPYAHPVIVPSFGGDDSDVDFALGLGVDIKFSPRWDVRLSGGIGDIEGVGISVAYIR